MGIEIGIQPAGHLKASDVAKFLKGEFHGEDVRIKTVKSLDGAVANAVVFCKNKVQNDLLERFEKVCLITSILPDKLGSNAFIIVENPRLAFARTLSQFFVKKNPPSIGQYSAIHPAAAIASSVIIGNHCTIGRDVEIGDYTEIRDNVVIADAVKIGRHCLIRSNSVIGEEGFGFEYEEDGRPIRIPHLGSVEIGDFVEIGNFTAIARGTLGNTVIHSYVKIDNLVHIAHNCVIGEKSLVIACAEVSGGSVVGKRCWLGPGCSTMQKIRLGDNCVVGIGSVVLEDVSSGCVVAGSPARLIRVKDADEE